MDMNRLTQRSQEALQEAQSIAHPASDRPRSTSSICCAR